MKKNNRGVVWDQSDLPTLEQGIHALNDALSQIKSKNGEAGIYLEPCPALMSLEVFLTKTRELGAKNNP